MDRVILTLTAESSLGPTPLRVDIPTVRFFFFINIFGSSPVDFGVRGGEGLFASTCQLSGTARRATASHLFPVRFNDDNPRWMATDWILGVHTAEHQVSYMLRTVREKDHIHGEVTCQSHFAQVFFVFP